MVIPTYLFSKSVFGYFRSIFSSGKLVTRWFGDRRECWCQRGWKRSRFIRELINSDKSENESGKFETPCQFSTKKLSGEKHEVIFSMRNYGHVFKTSLMFLTSLLGDARIENFLDCQLNLDSLFVPKLEFDMLALFLSRILQEYFLYYYQFFFK